MDKSTPLTNTNTNLTVSQSQPQEGYKINIAKKLGSGAFGAIYECIDLSNNQEYAAKVEPTSSNYPQLAFESKVLRYLKGGIGIPSVYSFFTHENSNYLIMDLLGSNLEQIIQKFQYQIPKRIALYFITQMLLRIEFLHSRNLIHRDIKPENFLLGKGKDKSTVYLIDFGISRQYRNSHTNKHIENDSNRPLIGTPRYASLNTHLGAELSRRDDIESLAYCMIYLWMGSLPWQGLCAKNEKDKHAKISDMKLGLSIKGLCTDTPLEFSQFLFYARNLEFEEKPDYKYLHGLITAVKEKVNQSERINVNPLSRVSSNKGDGEDNDDNEDHVALDCI